MAPNTESPTLPDESLDGDRSARAAPVELRELQRSLLRAVTSGPGDRKSVLARIGGIVNECLNPVAMRYYARQEDGPLEPIWQLVPGGGAGPIPAAEAAVLACCNAACAQGRLRIDELTVPENVWAIAVPVFLRQESPHALLILLPSTTRSLDRVMVTLQFVASHLTLWQVFQEASSAAEDARATAALVELLQKLAACEDLRHGCYTLVCGLKAHLACDDVALGLCRGRRRECHLEALSEHSQFDKHSSRTRLFEAAFDEAIVKGTPATWHAAAGTAQHSTRALAHLCSVVGATTGVSAPLEDAQGNAMGAWVFLAGAQSRESKGQTAFIQAASRPVGTALEVLRRAERGRLARLGRTLVEHRRSWQTKAAVIGVVLLTAILALPLPYRVTCDCEVEPVTRRFVVAPFQGRLERSFVEPGAVIHKNDLLARMDGRDVRCELAGLVAEHGRAAKRRDAAMASHDVVTAQLARLDMERLEANMTMLEDRAANLEIRSPIDGIVISGDQERAEGAPLDVGQGLFEIAPLDRMIVELAVPEEDIDHVRAGLQADIRLDAFPQHAWTGRIKTLHPRSEIRDEQNVFIAEVALDNADDLLRPGMNGRGKIVGDRHRLAWNLFHKPWEQLLLMVGW